MENEMTSQTKPESRRPVHDRKVRQTAKSPPKSPSGIGAPLPKYHHPSPPTGDGMLVGVKRTAESLLEEPPTKAAKKSNTEEELAAALAKIDALEGEAVGMRSTISKQKKEIRGLKRDISDMVDDRKEWEDETRDQIEKDLREEFDEEWENKMEEMKQERENLTDDEEDGKTFYCPRCSEEGDEEKNWR